MYIVCQGVDSFLRTKIQILVRVTAQNTFEDVDHLGSGRCQSAGLEYL